MKKNIQQLVAMVGVLEKSMQNEAMEGVISLRISKFSETDIHIRKELFLSTFQDYEQVHYKDEYDELFVYVEGIKVFTLTNAEGVPNA
ncbi:hypothetical protein [Psychrobacillus sp. BM2]|uniref:hypothetical protein n=1 Tax=Psychrobacillus sp. BM2 TaxID=3400421 RepID=UPI003B01B61C